MISFIIICHSSRIENLKQTIRFLEKRETIKKEFIIVSMDKIELETESNIKIINLDIDSYYKTFMTNEGVKASSFDILVLLDSDRILPNNYFSNSIKKFDKNNIISTSNLLQLLENYTDEEIEKGENLNFKEDFKSKDNYLTKKNLFAGNTILHKYTYWDLGGYDENFKGYGFADNDMTMKAMESSFNILWNNEIEYHLYHPKEMIWRNKIQEMHNLRMISCTNGFKYLKKWNILSDDRFNNMIKLTEHFSKYCSDSVKDEFYLEKNKFYSTKKISKFI